MSIEAEDFQLPQQSPDGFIALLEEWQSISQSHPPTWADLPFDDLVREHPGLAWIDPIMTGSDLVDFKYVRVGPEYCRQIKIDPLGLSYSDFVHPRLLARCIVVFGQAMATGHPHYWEVESSAHGYASTSYERLLLPIYDTTGQCVSFLIDCVWGSR